MSSAKQHTPGHVAAGAVATKPRLAPNPGVSWRRADIQGLRAVAVLSVIVFHATGALPGGYVGVDVFFVVSGFVITAMLAREWARHGRINLANFYVRRFKRLMPALMVVLTFTLIGTALLLAPAGAGQLSPQETVAVTAIGAVLLAANFVIVRTTGAYFDAEAATNPLLHTWSLSVEEQFYLVFPALLAVSWVVARHRRWHSAPAVLAVAVAGVGSLTLAVFGGAGGLPIPDSLIGFYGPAARVWEFAAGAVLALLHQRLAIRSVGVATLVGAGGGVGLLAALWLIDERTSFPGPWTVLPVLATVLVIAAGSRPENYLTRGLSCRPMVATGDLSYSLYLWHWPFIAFAALLWPGYPAARAWAAIFAFVPAVASYRFVERPLRNSEVRGLRLVRIGAAAIVPPLLLSGGIFALVADGYGDESVRRYQAGISTPHLSSAAGCTDHAWRKAEQCTWNASASGAPIYLVGDSNADHFTEGLLGAAEVRGRPLTVISQVGCTYVRVVFSSVDPAVTARCQDYIDGAERYLTHAPRGTVVIANSYLWWTESSNVALGVPGRPATSDPSQRLAELRAGLAAAVHVLVSSGHQVLLVQPVPFWGDDAGALSWAACSVLDMGNDACARSMRLNDARARQGPIWDVVQQIAKEQGVTSIDFRREICPREVCLSESPDGRITYRDGTHITRQESETLAGAYAAALARER